MYLGDDTGVYTDTAEFVDTIPECTNISIGYMFEHTQNEELNIYHFTALAAAVLTVAWDALPTDRDPTVVESKWDDPMYGLPSGGWSKNWWSSYKDDRMSPEYTLEMEVEDAIYDAMRGVYAPLVDLIAECVYPEDPPMAAKFLSKRKLTDDLLEEAKQMARAYDASTVLCTLFDAIHCEV
jgi:hypothetical protein